MIRPIKHAFYRCAFAAVAGSDERDGEAELTKAAALFELHRVDEARRILETMVATTESAATTYAVARLAYLDDRHEEALAAFHRILETAGAGVDGFRARLGIANCLASMGQGEKALAAARELEGAQADAADRLSLDLLLGTLLVRHARDHAAAEKRLAQALRRAEQAHWLYFQQRALYYLADLEVDRGRPDEAKGILRVLTALVDPDASIYLCHLINRRFGALDACLPARFRLDPERCRAWIDDGWYPLHDKPLVFALLAALHGRAGGVDKEALSQALWPAERYKPHVHDARIFDLVRRTRAEIERYSSQPVSLISGRDGYRLITHESKT